MMRMWLHTRVAMVAAACCLVGGMLAGVPGLLAAPAAAASTAGSLYTPLGPVRVLDTRSGLGGHTGPVGAGQTITLQVTGANGVPSGASAVVLNVTATSPSASSFVTVYPDGSTRPVASNLNFTRGETIPNLVVVPVTDGKIDFYNQIGTVNLIADLAGFYSASGSSYVAAGPVRVLDTRNGTGGHSGPVGAQQSVSLQIAGANGVPSAGVTAVVLNVTATSPSTSSFVTVYPDGSTRPVASNLNFTAGETIPNLVVVPVTDGKVDLYNQAGTVNLIADLAGYYISSSAGSPFTAAGPVRLLDTRNGTGGHTGPVGAGQSISLQVAGVDGVPSSGVTAVVLNVTATSPSTSSFVTVFPDGSTRPVASDLNFTAGETIPNLVVVPVAADGKVAFYNQAGTVNLIADLAGYYTAGGPTWGNAIQIPGFASLSSQYSQASLVSCPSAGNCTAGGFYLDSSGIPQAFVADEVNGTWGNAIEVPGTAALNTGSNGAQVLALSCASAGNCTAGGQYTDGANLSQAFVASEVDGIWGTAIELPGTATLNTGSAQVFSVSCPSAGNCAAGGSYDDSSGNVQAFVADEVNGTWSDAIEVPGTAALNNLGSAEVNSVSCPSAGNCTAGGSSGSDAFVASEVNGTWNDAIVVPGFAALNVSGPQVISVSCPSVGNCSAGGLYEDTSAGLEAFVVSETNGTWGNAIVVPGTAAVNAGGNAEVTSVSCPSAGNCVAGGEVAIDSSTGISLQPFVADEVNGTWNDAIEVPGIPVAPSATTDTVTSVSCGSPGNCAAGGLFSEGTSTLAFVVSEVGGNWGDAIQAPGISGTAVIFSVSCPATGGCTAGGGSPGGQAFVVSQN